MGTNALKNPKPPKQGFMNNVSETSYKGNPILALYRNAEDRFPFQFGVAKAELILRNLEAIRAFVKKHGESAEA